MILVTRHSSPVTLSQRTMKQIAHHLSFALSAAIAFAFAACSTTPTAAPGVEVRDDPSLTIAAPAAALSVADEARAVIKELRNYSVHSFTADVHAKLPPALAFLDAHKGDVSNRQVLAEVADNVIKTSVRANDLDIALPIAEELLSATNAPYSWRIDAADYLARRDLRKDDYAAADARDKAVLACPTSGRGLFNRNDRSRIVALRAALFTRRNDMAGALKVIADARAETPYGDDPNAGVNVIWRSLLDDEAVNI